MDAVYIQKYTDEVLKMYRGVPTTPGSATAVLAATGSIKSAVVNAAGSGYAVGNILTVATGTGGTFTVTSVNGSGSVTGVSRLASGSGYANVTGAATTVSPSGGTGCTLNTTCEFAVASITIGAGGTGYISASAIFSGGGSITTEKTTATVTAGAVTAIALPTGKFTSAPTITIAGGGQTTAADFLTAIKAFDTSKQNERLKLILDDVLINGLIPEPGYAVIDAAIKTL